MSLRVLIVEEDEALASSMATALNEAGHEVAFAASGEDALLHRSFDVVVADIDLPGIDGLDLVEALLQRGDNPRTVVISGRADVDEYRRALRLGADDFLTKPVAPEDIVRAVEGRPAGSALMGTVFARKYEAGPETGTEIGEQAARELVAHALRCAISPAARARIGSSCAELVENVAIHAYAGGSGPLRVVATVDRRELELVISDDGVGFDPLEEGLDHLSDCRAGGLARVATLAEDVLIESSPGSGTRVVVRFDVARALFDEDMEVDLSELDWLPPRAVREVLAACEEDPGGASRFVLSPALAVSLGRLLAGPDPRRVLRTALWS